jgi:hypothetical protein
MYCNILQPLKEVVSSCMIIRISYTIAIYYIPTTVSIFDMVTILTYRILQLMYARDRFSTPLKTTNSIPPPSWRHYVMHRHQH